MSEESKRIAMGFDGAAEAVGLSKRFLQLASNDPDPKRRLKTVRVATRRLIRPEDLQDWFNRVAREEAMENRDRDPEGSKVAEAA